MLSDLSHTHVPSVWLVTLSSSLIKVPLSSGPRQPVQGSGRSGDMLGAVTAVGRVGSR